MAATVAVLSLSFSGCAALSRSECKTANWHTIGYEDGVAGRAAARIGDYRKACAEYGISPDLGRYLEGRAAGLKLYCRPAHGFHLGLNGFSYNDVCPSGASALFFRAYEEGWAIHVAQKEVDAAERRLREKLEERRDLVRAVKQYERELIDSGTTRKRRAELLQRIQSAQDRSERLGWAIDHLRDERAVAEQRVNEATRAAHAW